MPGPRLSKSIARWVAVARPQRPTPLKRAIRYVSWTACAVAALWLIVSAALGRRTIYRAGPLAGVHQSFADECHKCHQSNWRGLERLARFDNSHTSTPNEACTTCHRDARHQSHIDHPLAATHQCADCHREHQGHQRLVQVDEQLCVECHGDLATDKHPPRTFVEAVPDFERHPEFALHRKADPTPDARHFVHAVAERAADDSTAPWVDKARRRFGPFKHATHMNPDGVLMPASDGTEGTREKLACNSCHRPDVHGAYMLPVRYETHCRNCHPLSLDADLGDRRLAISLPHREPELVRGAIRQRLVEEFMAAPADADRSPPEADGPRNELLGRPGLPRPLPVDETELERLNRIIQQADHAVFGNEAKGGCRFCHVVDNDATRWRVVPPDLPDRWLLHSRFDHGRHATEKCSVCHAASESTATADILLPKIEVCQSCHRPADGRGNGGARTDCVECHDYHGRTYHANLVPAGGSESGK